MGTNKNKLFNSVPGEPFEPILRAQDPFRSGQDNLEPIYDSSGIEIGTNFGSPGYTTVTMQDERKERSQNVV